MGDAPLGCFQHSLQSHRFFPLPPSMSPESLRPAQVNLRPTHAPLRPCFRLFGPFARNIGTLLQSLGLYSPPRTVLRTSGMLVASLGGSQHSPQSHRLPHQPASTSPLVPAALPCQPAYLFLHLGAFCKRHRHPAPKLGLYSGSGQPCGLLGWERPPWEAPSIPCDLTASPFCLCQSSPESPGSHKPHCGLVFTCGGIPRESQAIYSKA